MLPDSRLTRARLLTESRRSKAARRWPTAMDTDFLFAALMHWQAVRLCPVWVDFTHGKCHAEEKEKKISQEKLRESRCPVTTGPVQSQIPQLLQP